MPTTGSELLGSEHSDDRSQQPSSDAKVVYYTLVQDGAIRDAFSAALEELMKAAVPGAVENESKRETFVIDNQWCKRSSLSRKDGWQ